MSADGDFSRAVKVEVDRLFQLIDSDDIRGDGEIQLFEDAVKRLKVENCERLSYLFWDGEGDYSCSCEGHDDDGIRKESIKSLFDWTFPKGRMVLDWDCF